jgi:hypothetical protein
MAENHQILGVHITDRLTEAGVVQAVFTEFGCNIRTRVGLHDTDGTVCSPSGVVLLDLIGAESDCDALTARLDAIDGVEVQRMVFTHE